MVGHHWIGVALAWWGQKGYAVDRGPRITRCPSWQFAEIITYYLVLKQGSALG